MPTVSTLFLQELRMSEFSNRNAHIVGCSAVSSAGLREGMDWLVSDIRDRMYFFTDESTCGNSQTNVALDTGCHQIAS